MLNGQVHGPAGVVKFPHRRVGQIRPCEPGAGNMRWEDGGVSSPSASAPPAAVVIRISPMAHFAVGFFALGLLAVVFAEPAWVALMVVISVTPSAMIVRYRTLADRDTV